MLVGALAYANSFAGQFMLDDDRSISDNVSAIASLTSPHKIIGSPLFVTRPVVGFSLALSYALSGLKVWGYHLVNLTIHLLAALALWDLLRRSLRAVWAEQPAAATPDRLAWLIATIWTVHPLQTQAVTYVIQRTEALAGLFYLLTLLGLARSQNGHRRLWSIGAVVSCALGMGSKQVVLTAPFAALLYDRTFLSGSFRKALRLRWGLYLGLAATLAIPFISLHLAPTTLGAGFGATTVTWQQYARTQPQVILHYLRLCFWPYPQCLDDMWPVANGLTDILPGAFVLAAVAVATLWSLARKPALAFLGSAFFLLLAVSSSVIPIDDLAFEHRMYLASATVITFVVLAGHAAFARIRAGWHRKVGAVLSATVVLACAATTVARNRDYGDQIVMWSGVVAQRPGNFRAHNNLGLGLRAAGRHAEAEAEFREAVRLNPTCWYALYNLGVSLDLRGAFAESVAYYERTLRSTDYAPAHAKLANALNNVGLARRGEHKLDEAAALFRKAIAVHPPYWQAHHNLGLVLSEQGHYADAIVSFRQALQLNPGYGEAAQQAAWAAYHLGLSKGCAGDPEGAQVSFGEALALLPTYGDARRALEQGRQGRGLACRP